MPLIVDAYNAIHVWRNAPLEEGGADVRAMAQRVARSRWGGGKCVLVCDGVPPAGSDSRHRFAIEGVQIVYAGGGVEADEVIERLIAKDSAPARLTVVSSDRRVQRAASRRGAAVLPSDRFLAQMETDAAAGGGKQAGVSGARDDAALGGNEINSWLQAFGMDQRIDAKEHDAQRKKKDDPFGDLDMDDFMDGVEKL